MKKKTIFIALMLLIATTIPTMATVTMNNTYENNFLEDVKTLEPTYELEPTHNVDAFEELWCPDCDPRENKDEKPREKTYPQIDSSQFPEKDMSSPTLQRAIVYVDDDNTQGPWDGSIDFPYQTIQDGVNNANPGDTVFVFNGHYSEHVVVNKQLNVFGESQSAIIDGTADGYPISLITDNINIRTFTVKNGLHGVVVYGVTNCSVSDCTVQGNELDGIIICNSSKITVSNCYCANNWWEGIDLWPASDCIITNNVCHMNGDGFCIYSDWGWMASNNTVMNCEFENSWASGAWISQTDNNTFVNCTFNGNYEGLWIQTQSCCSTFIDCEIYNNDEEGLFIGWQSNANNFDGCEVEKTNSEPEAGFGVYISDSIDNSFVACDVHNNIFGIYLKQAPGTAFTGGNNIYDNDFNFNFEPNYGAQDLYLNVDQSNFVEGKQMYWIVGVDGYEINATHNAGYVAFVDSTNVVIKDTVASGILMLNSMYSTISNVEVHHSKHGILLRNSQHIDIVDSSGYLNMNGVMAMESPYVNVIGCAFHDNPSHNCYDGRGICLMYSSYGGSIINCTVSNSSWIGIGADWTSHHTTIKNCSSYGNYGECHPGGPYFGYGIVLYYYVDNCIVENCVTYDNYNSGITVFHGNYNKIINCVSYDNQESGIYIYSGAESNEVIGCEVYENDIGGITIWKSDYNTIRDCEIYNNNYGVYIYEESDDNKIFHNNITDNTQNAQDSCTNIWDDDYPSGGNHWSDYTGIDSDGDGIGDTPYPIPGGSNEDRYPLVYEQTVNNPPEEPTIEGEVEGVAGETYDYTFSSVDPDDNDVYIWVDWGDDNETGWVGPFSSGEEVTLSHSWEEKDTYTIRAKAKDIYDAESDWGTLEITMPVSQHITMFSVFVQFLQKILDRCPAFEQLFAARPLLSLLLSFT